MSCDIAVDQAPAPMFDDDDDIQLSERGSDGNEKVARHNRLSVQSKNRRPAHIASRSTGGSFRSVLVHRPRRDSNIELEKLLVGNAFYTPRRVFIGHPADERLNLRRNWRPASPTFCRQKSFHPARCQRIIVSGLKSGGSRHPGPSNARRRRSLSPIRRGGRCGRSRLMTAGLVLLGHAGRNYRCPAMAGPGV